MQSVALKERPISWDVKTQIGVAAFFCVGLLLFLPFRSIQWDPNGITEAINIQSGFLLHPNHLLYRPLSLLIYTIVSALGFHVPIEIVLQYITALSAALCLCFVFAAYSRLTDNHIAAALGTLLLAVSWSYWKFSTDIYYIPLTALTTSAAVYLFSRPHQNWASAAGAGILCACSILFWQANIFCIPGLTFLLWQHTREKIRAYRFAYAATFLAVAGLIVAVVYMGVSMSVHPGNPIAATFKWLTSYSTDVGGKPPIWGAWSISHVPELLKSQLSSFIPVWEGLGLHQLRRGIFQPEKLLGQLSLLSILALVFGAVVHWWKHRAVKPNWLLLWALGSYCMYLPFIFWWDPFEPKWFVLPNIFLLIAFAAIMRQNLTQKIILPMLLGIFIIFAANFQMAILPRHSVPNPRIVLAQCFANHATDKDGVVVHMWGWVDYAEYFSKYSGQVICFNRDPDNLNGNRLLIQQKIDEITQAGGKLYTPAWTPEEVIFLHDTQGIELDKIFADFVLTPAFTCQDRQFLLVTSK